MEVFPMLVPLQLLGVCTRSNGSTATTSNGQFKGIVMDGRDIGTTVFPDAELKYS